jgi:Zn finger protein HypA/HybF involved in hydrogenase expression
MKIIPRKTRVRCKDCGHLWIIRRKELGVCPRCWHKNLEVVIDFTSMRERLLVRA